MNTNQILKRAKARLEAGVATMDVHIPGGAPVVGANIRALGAVGKVTAAGPSGAIVEFNCRDLVEALDQPITASSR